MKLKKTVFTLNVDNYCPEISRITFPLIKFWAHKIGAEFFEITERRFPQFPVTYEKMQIYTLGREMGNDWNIYLDADAGIHPSSPDWTVYMRKDQVAHWSCDVASLRWVYDEYFLRDGRNWGTGNWFTIASDWCLDLWHPLEDLTLEEAVERIYPIMGELNNDIVREHLIDDYVLSRNVARYGLKTVKIKDLRDQIELKDAPLCMHLYRVANEVKVRELQKMIKAWELPDSIKNYGNHDT
jgi:hypothetical protein